jgi:hypothetical protein
MKSPTAKAIAIATAICGTLDILFAMILTMTLGKGDIPAMLRFVASGPFPTATDMGTAGAVLGLVTHFTLMAAMVTVFVFAVRARPSLLDRPALAGLAYGLITYFVMNWLVVPLRFDAPLPLKPMQLATQLFAHIALVGLPTAFITRRYLRS